MLIRSVIAAEITNLTDARYFAARGVDYLLYDLSQIGINEVMAIAEWVEGVKTLVRMNDENIHLIDEVLLRITPHAVGTSEKISFEKLLTYVSEGPIFHFFPEESNQRAKVILTDVDNIDSESFQISLDSTVLAFSEVTPSKAGLSEFLSQNKNAGIILKGSSEIETGLKSFDNIDLLLDLLEEH